MVEAPASPGLSADATKTGFLATNPVAQFDLVDGVGFSTSSTALD